MQALITEKNEQIALQTPFNRGFVNDLKDEIHYTERQWDGSNKVWWVDKTQADKAISIASRYFEVVDGRKKSVDEIEEAQLDAEISKIKNDQKTILDNEEYIKKIIDRLENAISRYSPRSSSNVKYTLAKDQALLNHSLRNARIPVDQLVELQVRGLAAAARLIDGGYNPPKGSHI